MEQTGVIMRFDPDKGYGFIKPDGGGKDLFLHVSELRHMDPQEIKPGTTRVSFGESDSGRGPKAVNVYALDSSDATADRLEGEPALPTAQAWRELWDRVSGAAFKQLMAEARANGWVQDG